MRPYKRKIEIWQGKTKVIVIRVRVDANGAPMDLTDFSARMQVRPDYTSETVTLDLTSEVDGGIQVSEAEGKVTITITADQAAEIAAGNYKYDLEIYNDSGYVFCPIYGIFKVHPEVTKAAT